MTKVYLYRARKDEWVLWTSGSLESCLVTWVDFKAGRINREFDAIRMEWEQED